MSEFDPRFDPAFQRGYDSPDPVGPKTTDASAPAHRRQPGGTAEPAVSAEPAAHLGEGVGQNHLRSNDDDHDHDLGPEPRGINPFLIALVAAAAVFVAVGLGLVSQIQSITDSADSNYDYVLVQTLMIGSPIIIGLGLATGVGVLFLFAARWRR